MYHKMPDQRMNVETGFEKLQQAISQIARKGPFVVLGDFNSRRQGRHVLGPHMFGKGWAAVGEETDNRLVPTFRFLSCK